MSEEPVEEEGEEHDETETPPAPEAPEEPPEGEPEEEPAPAPAVEPSLGFQEFVALKQLSVPAAAALRRWRQRAPCRARPSIDANDWFCVRQAWSVPGRTTMKCWPAPSENRPPFGWFS